MKSSLVVLVPKYGMECVVEVNDLDRLQFDPEKISFVEKDNPEKVVYKLFQHIQIQISVLEHEASLRERLVVKIADENEAEKQEDDVDMDMNNSPKRKLEE